MKSDADAMDVDGGATRSLEELTFDNLQLRALPVDPDTENRTTPRRVPGACFSLARPTSLERPRLVAASPDVLALLGIRADQVERPDFAAFFCGNKLLPGSQPAAHCYCGHQFGHFSGQLGDGATMYLGELLTPRGERWEVQFKGAGRTPTRWKASAASPPQQPRPSSPPEGCMGFERFSVARSAAAAVGTLRSPPRSAASALPSRLRLPPALPTRHAVLAHCRRAQGAPLEPARVPGVGGEPRARGPHHARGHARHLRHARGERRLLRRDRHSRASLRDHARRRRRLHLELHPRTARARTSR